MLATSVPIGNGGTAAPPVAATITQPVAADAGAFGEGVAGAPLAEDVTEGWWDWDLVTDKLTFSAQWKAMLGYQPDEIANGPGEWFDRVHADDREQLKAALDAHLDGRAPHLDNQHRIRRRDGTYSYMLGRALAFRDGNGRPVRITGSHTDITELRGYDTLTGLPNRTSLIDRLGRALERTRAGDGHLSAVLFMDLDRFKNINYSLGHRVGDQLLKAVSGRLRSCLRGAMS